VDRETYGKPVVPFADGTVKNSAKIDSGEYRGGKLKFRFAERAFVSSPIKPKTLLVGGKPHAFIYDEGSDLVTITRTGPPAEVVLTFGAERK